MIYYTVVIPYAEGTPTEWHPTERLGPFSTLQRGVFQTQLSARAWAREHLAGTPFTVKAVDMDESDPYAHMERFTPLTPGRSTFTVRFTIEGLADDAVRKAWLSTVLDGAIGQSTEVEWDFVEEEES